MIASSETEVGKIFTADTRSDIGSEAEKMKYANAVNGLVAKFIRLAYDDTIKADMPHHGMNLSVRLPGV